MSEHHSTRFGLSLDFFQQLSNTLCSSKINNHMDTTALTLPIKFESTAPCIANLQELRMRHSCIVHFRENHGDSITQYYKSNRVLPCKDCLQGVTCNGNGNFSLLFSTNQYNIEEMIGSEFIKQGEIMYILRVVEDTGHYEIVLQFIPNIGYINTAPELRQPYLDYMKENYGFE